MQSFRDINFKYTDAQSELAYAPELIRHAYVDIENATDQVLNTSRFIVYGPKGSGKTALAGRLILASRDDGRLNVESDDLESFDFDLLREIDARDAESIGGSLAALKSMLMIRLFSTLSKDGVFAGHNTAFLDVQRQLTLAGFLRRPSITGVAEEAARPGAFERLASIFSSSRHAQAEPVPRDPAAVADHLETIVNGLKPGHQHLLLLDGLDYPLRKGRDNTGYISELLEAVTSVNAHFASARVDAKIVLLMRDDVLKVLPNPNLAKRVTDHGLHLNWYDNVGEPFRTKLLEVISLRARLAGFEAPVEQLFLNWFGREKVNRTEPITFILDHTRYLPRDLISVLRSLQGLGVEPPFSYRSLRGALRNYSDWFYDELSDSLVGLMPESVRTSLSGILGGLGSRFRFEDLRAALEARGLTEMPSEVIARQLFSAGWIGNVAMNANGYEMHWWQHRARRAEFDPGKMCMVHRGLRRALNLSE